MSAAPHNDKIEHAPRGSDAVRGDNESDLKREEPVLLKSSHDSLGYWKTARIFWKVSSHVDKPRRTKAARSSASSIRYCATR